jgi:hypothetical protein
VLTALAEGRLPADETSRAAAHVVSCATCHEAAGDLAAMLGEGRETSALVVVPGTRARRVRWVAAAAVLLVAVGAATFALSRGPTRDGAALASAADEAGIRLLTAVEMRERPLGVERGGLTVLAPRGAVPGGRPEVRFTPVPGATRVRVRVRDEDGVVRAEGESSGERFAWPEDAPPLPPGSRAVALVVAETPTGDVEGSAAFSVLADARRVAYERDLERAARAPSSLRSLLSAHAAAGRSLWSEALRALDRASAEGAPAADVQALRGRVEHQLGIAGP